MALGHEFDGDVTYSDLFFHFGYMFKRETELICCMKPFAKPCTECDKSRRFDVET